jgi:hypothetical protein
MHLSPAALDAAIRLLEFRTVDALMEIFGDGDWAADEVELLE